MPDARDHLIASQAVKIERLERELKARREGMDKAHTAFICIGGPLNDNRLQFNSEQRKYLHRINALVEAGEWITPEDPNFEV